MPTRSAAKSFPGTAEKLSALARTLKESPVDVTIEHPTTGEPVSLTFDRDVLSSSLRFLAYSSDTQAMLPLLIHEAARNSSVSTAWPARCSSRQPGCSKAFPRAWKCR